MAGFFAAAGFVGGAVPACGGGAADSHKRLSDIGVSGVKLQTVVADNVVGLEHQGVFDVGVVLALLGWQSWRLNNAGHTIGTQAEALKKSKQELAKKNSQLISLSILTETNSRAQMQLYAAAEETSALLRSRQRRIEELKRENEDLRRWADTPLPADIIRLRDRPALAGGAAYREWLSKSDAVPPGQVSAAQ